MDTAIIVGLGNPGVEYANTRHNAGFMVIDRLLEKFKNKFEQKRFHNSVVWIGKIRGRLLLLGKPMTYMNSSGDALGMFSRKFKLLPSQFLVVYDDMDIDFGKIRIRKRGGDGGHNGIKSIISEFGTESFPRLRVGIGKSDRVDQVDYVLGGFSKLERERFDKALDLSVEAVQTIIYRGIDKAMNEFNGKEKEKSL